MATRPMAMERPPVSPDIQAQLGGGGGGGETPFAGVGGMMAQRDAAGNPLKNAYDGVEKVLTNMVRMNNKMGPYVQRAIAILKAGMEEAGGQKPEGQTQGRENAGAVPQGASAGNMPG